MLPVIAIDGPSGAGKSSVARALAKQLDYNYIDTGALYRCVAKLADDNQIDWSQGDELAKLASQHQFSFDKEGNLSLDGVPVGNSIRTPRISMGASAVAAHKEVRVALLHIQRDIGQTTNAVLEGRDIGTNVFPNAKTKIYLTASVKERAKRRHLELINRGEKISLEQIEKDQENRDKADSERKESPLRKADDAIEINCDNLNINQVVKRIIDVMNI